MQRQERLAALTRRRRDLTLAFLASLFLGTALPSFAAEVCVANDTQLAAALNAARTSAQTIKLVQHTYHLDATVWNNPTVASPVFRDGSSLLGGYTDNCAGRDIAVGNTVITDTTAAAYDGASITGDATIEGITFNLPKGLYLTADSTTNGDIATGAQLAIRRNVFTDVTGAASLPLSIRWSEPAANDGVIRLVDNLVYGNGGGSGTTDAAAIDVTVQQGNPKVELINNTVVDNTGSLGGATVENFVPISVYAYNNIFYGNAQKDFTLNLGTSLILVDNVIGTHSYSAPATAPVGTTTGDPKLDANHRPIEAPPSPVINSGTDSVIGGLPATDLAGRARIVGSEPDRGAFESTINDSPLLNVTTNNDSGVGSLRAAITSANANGASGGAILFNIPGTCPQTITLQTPLPNITSETHVLGSTQTGSSENTLSTGDDAQVCVILDGGTHNIADGFYVAANAPATAKLSVTSMAFSGFTHSAIGLYGSSGHSVVGSHIGGQAAGVALDPVANGIIIGPAVHDVTIGGDDYADRNVIGAATANGIVIDGPTASLGGGHDNLIKRNFIGVGWSVSGNSYTARGNGNDGVLIAGHDNEVQSNYIEYNAHAGVELTGSETHDNAISSNFIGYLASYTDVGSGNGTGVLLQNGAHDNRMASNSIWFNDGTGIRIVNGRGNYVFANQLNGNGGLGIDLGTVGVSPNDNDSLAQAPDSANRGLNWPLVTSAIGTSNAGGTITGTLTTTPGTYTVQAYLSASCDPSGYGEGTFIATSSIVVISSTGTVNGQNTTAFTASNQGNFAANPYVTMTAIDASRNTSELSPCFLLTNDTIFENDFD